MHSYLQATKRIAAFLNQPKLLNSIHYACESFYYTEPPTRISAIAVKNCISSQSYVFSIFNYVTTHGQAGNQVLNDPDLYSKAELAMLDDFYAHVVALGATSALWFHWNMSSASYGFAHIENRYQALGKTPTLIPDDNKLDLSAAFHDIYGAHYMCDPKFLNLAKGNDLKGQHFMSGDKEAFAFLAGQWGDIHNSTKDKASLILELAQLANHHKLKTHVSTFKAYYLNWIDAQRTDHPIMFGITILGLISSIIGIFSFHPWK